MPYRLRLDVVVLGGGIAGLTAGLFAARLGRSTTVLVPLMVGGPLATINLVEDFPGFPQGVAGYDLGPMIQEQAAAARANFRMTEALRLDAIEGGWQLATTDGPVDASTVIIATGSQIRTLGVPGEARLIGKGVSHCASCDGPLLKGKSVVVVGAGDSGMQEAVSLAEFASAVAVIDQSPRSAAQAVYQRRVHDHAKIAMHLDTRVEEIFGDEVVTGIRTAHATTGMQTNITADAVFIYAGFVPNTAWLSDTVSLDSAGHVLTDHWMRTNRAGIFAAGDVRAESACQAVTAAGDGATAAIAADRFLREGSLT